MTKEVKEGRILVHGRVNHSQRARDTPLKPWLLCEKDGSVLLAHCDCMAGLSEACSHIGALLFATESWYRLNSSTTCTEELSTWLPSHIKKVPYLPVSEIDFTSAKKRMHHLEAGEGKTEEKRRKSQSTLFPPSEDEKNIFFSALAAVKVDSSVLSLVPPYNQKFIAKENENIPKPLTALYSDEHMSLNYLELLGQCDKTIISITEKECEAVERETRQQSQSKTWFDQRAGRITASKLRAACHTDPAKPSKSLIKTICYPEAHKFTSVATR